MGKIGYSKSLLIPIVAIFVLTIGMINEPQNAYAGINGNGENQLPFGVKSLVNGHQEMDSGNSEVTTNFRLSQKEMQNVY